MALHKDQLFYASSAPITANGDSTAIQTGPGEFDIALDVKSVSEGDGVTFKIQESADGITYTDLHPFAAVDGPKLLAAHVQTRKEYLRVNHVVTGESVSIPVAGGVVIGQDGATRYR